MLVAATGLLGGCDSIDFLNPFAPDKVDLQPLFAELVPNQTWTVGTAVHLSLPAASEGNPPLTYNLSPDLPAGLTFDASARTLTGTPTAVLPMTGYIIYRHRRRRRYRVDPVPGQRGRGIHRSLT